MTSVTAAFRRFRTIWKWLVPGWLQAGEGELVQHVQGLINDAYAERMRQTALLMFPSRAPSDALPLIGKDRGLKQGLFEPDVSYRERLKAWRYPLGHRVRGTALALLEQVASALRGTQYFTVDARGTLYERGVGATPGTTWAWDAVPLLPSWGRYWVVVKSTGRAWPSFADGAWGPTVGGYRHTICLAGSGVHPGELAAVKELVRPGALSWTPAGRQAIYLVLYFDGSSFPAPTGDWDSWANRDRAYRYVPLRRDVG